MTVRSMRWLHYHVSQLTENKQHRKLLQYVGDRLIVRFRIRSFYGIEGWLKIEEAAMLYRIARRLPPESTIVEIGSWKGKSTYCLACGLRSGRIVAIDPFDASGDAESQPFYLKRHGQTPLYIEFQQQMKELGVAHKIVVKQGFSAQFVGIFPRIDLLFIDGDHSREGTLFDFENYAPYVPVGGYIAFHDYQNRADPAWGPNWVVDRYLVPSENYQCVGLHGSLWIARKTNA